MDHAREDWEKAPHGSDRRTGGGRHSHSGPRKATGLSLIQDEKGQRLSYFALRSRFDKARKAAKVSFQFRDIRAKSATDAEDLQYAQKLRGHKHQAMTQHYTRNRKGEKVRPLK